MSRGFRDVGCIHLVRVWVTSNFRSTLLFNQANVGRPVDTIGRSASFFKIGGIALEYRSKVWQRPLY
jgi:hypothetical protein